MALTSAQVGRLQNALNGHGAAPPLIPDQKFGPLTLRALQNFQRANNLPIRYDYTLDSQTAQALGLDFSSAPVAGGGYGADPAAQLAYEQARAAQLAQAARAQASGATASNSPAVQSLKSALVYLPGGVVAFLFEPAIATGLFTAVANSPGYFTNAAGNLFRKIVSGAREYLIPADSDALGWLYKLGIVATSLLAIGPLIGIGVGLLLLVNYLGSD